MLRSARMRSAAVVWRIDAELVLALEARFGTPVDSYVNGSQTWLVDNGPGGVTIEWRLHPVAAYRPPRGLSHYDLWDQVVGQLSAGADPAALTLGEEPRPLTSLWDGLEAFAAYGDDVEPATLAQAAGAALDRPPAATGLVDHDRIGDEWERSRGQLSIMGLLLDELHAT
jgi:hypothetical protein